MHQLTLSTEQLQILQEALHTYLGEFEEACEYAPPEWKQQYIEADKLHKEITSKLSQGQTPNEQ